jgi:hypothetical protein
MPKTLSIFLLLALPFAVVAAEVGAAYSKLRSVCRVACGDRHAATTVCPSSGRIAIRALGAAADREIRQAGFTAEEYARS